jgi:hypothetical protein
LLAEVVAGIAACFASKAMFLPLKADLFAAPANPFASPADPFAFSKGLSGVGFRLYCEEMAVTCKVGRLAGAGITCSTRSFRPAVGLA